MLLYEKGGLFKSINLDGIEKIQNKITSPR